MWCWRQGFLKDDAFLWPKALSKRSDFEFHIFSWASVFHLKTVPTKLSFYPDVLLVHSKSFYLKDPHIQFSPPPAHNPSGTIVLLARTTAVRAPTHSVTFRKPSTSLVLRADPYVWDTLFSDLCPPWPQLVARCVPWSIGDVLFEVFATPTSPS